jgi:MHS family citrate/tricarballylate:H+ symporter-like MFS transporter
MSAGRLSKRNVAAAIAGNALEFYDFVTFAFFAVQIGHVFFPVHSAYASLMLSLGTFGAGFAMRPVGGFVLGRYADRAGRKPAMLLSLALMGAAILAVAIIPPFSMIGAAAPALVVIARLVQGFALGGEVGSTTAFLLEAAPQFQRGFYTAWQNGSQYAASIAGGLVGVLLSAFMTAGNLEAYGWRIAFALGALTLPFGILIRRSLPETLHLPDEMPARAQTDSDWAQIYAHARVIVLGFVILASGTIFTYVTNYMTTFAETVLHMGNGISFAATLVVGGCGLVAVLFGGWLSDRIGRWPVMVWPRLAYLILIYPMYAWMVEAQSALALLSATAVLVVFGTMGYGAFYAAMTESLPKRIRGRVFATVYAVSIAIFGGTTQLIITWLIHVTGNPLALAWYLIASGVFGVAAMAMMAETAPTRTGAALRPVAVPTSAE